MLPLRTAELFVDCTCSKQDHVGTYGPNKQQTMSFQFKDLQRDKGGETPASRRPINVKRSTDYTNQNIMIGTTVVRVEKRKATGATSEPLAPAGVTRRTRGEVCEGLRDRHTHTARESTQESRYDGSTALSLSRGNYTRDPSACRVQIQNISRCCPSLPCCPPHTRHSPDVPLQRCRSVEPCGRLGLSDSSAYPP